MKNICKSVVREYLSRCLADERKAEHLTQARFAERLMMDTRSYADLEHANSLCGTLTFIIFLCDICKDPAALISDLRQLLLDARNSEKGFLTRYISPCAGGFFVS